jgi:hypothetical protein
VGGCTKIQGGRQAEGSAHVSLGQEHQRSHRDAIESSCSRRVQIDAVRFSGLNAVEQRIMVQYFVWNWENSVTILTHM